MSKRFHNSIKILKLILNNFNKFEYYFIKSLGWFFVLIGLNNLKNYSHLFIPIFDRHKIKEFSSSLMEYLFDISFIYVLTPFFLGGIFLLKRKE